MKKRSSNKKKNRGWDPTPWLVALLVLSLIGYLYLSVHGPILIHLW